MANTSPEIDLPKDFYHFNKWMLDTNKEMFEKLLILYHAYDKLNIAVYIHDLNKLRHVWTNNKYIKLIGYTEQEVKEAGPGWAMKNYHPDDLKVIWDRINFFRENKGETYSSIYRVRHKRGHWVWIYSSSAVFKRDNDNNVQQLLGIAVDFTKDFMSFERIEELVSENRLLRSRLLTSQLSDREIEIVKYIARGESSTNIAELLNLSEHTVRNHRKNILKKLGLHNTAALVSFAVEHKII